MMPAKELAQKIYLETYGVLKDSCSNPHEISKKLATMELDRMLKWGLYTPEFVAEVQSHIQSMP